MDGRILYPDFQIVPTRLLIEVDGSIHWNVAVDRDCKRDFWFEERGFKVLHISNTDAQTMTQERLAKLIQAVYPTFPKPSPEMDLNLKLYRERNLVMKARRPLTQKEIGKLIRLDHRKRRERRAARELQQSIDTKSV